MSSGFRHILRTKQFLNIKRLEKIFRLADKMERNDKRNALPKSLQNKILASVFYEPSTRTRFSFESAMLKLGGGVVSAENAGQFSSAIKGESLEDTIRIISGYADVIVLRHPKEGSAEIASEISAVPIINAGDGGGEHPTQALSDIYTIKRELGRCTNLKIALVGDLLYGRTVHSLLYLLGLYRDIKIYFISPSQLRLPAEYASYLMRRNIDFEEQKTLNNILKEIDVLYVTRIQKERFSSQKEYEKIKDSYLIDRETLTKMKKSAIIMHPLPRVSEISSEVDNDSRAVYFRQSKNGLYIRMALLQMVLSANI